MADTKAPRNTAKTIILKAILAKKTDDQIIALVLKEFPESGVDKKHCTKYRKELFNDDKIDAPLAACGSVEHKEWATAHMAAAKKGVHKAFWIQKDKDAKAKAIADKKAAAEKAKQKKAA